jgi:diguanylate cyclase (GGDEF)-like protein
MNYSFLRLHKALFFYLVITITFIVSGAFYIGVLKQEYEFDWFDAIGEGGITLMILIWIFFTLVSRPAGRVTNLLFIGLTLTHISMLLDFLDEFLRYPQDWAWLSTIESLPAPLGMIIMTFALYHWHQEQNSINNQLRRTERFYREHSLTDFITGLYSADYMKKQIQLEVNHTKDQNASFALVMLDICQFSQFNDHYGYKNGDNLLREVAQLITMNIRDGDLACRYASDRFIVLMPNTHQSTADEIAQQIKQLIEHLAYKLDSSSQAIYSQVNTCSHQYRGWNNFEEILTDINQHLLLAKSVSRKIYSDSGKVSA